MPLWAALRLREELAEELVRNKRLTTVLAMHLAMLPKAIVARRLVCKLNRVDSDTALPARVQTWLAVCEVVAARELNHMASCREWVAVA